jgi:uncharacterized membrane protein
MFKPLFIAPLAVQIHVFSTVTALILGGFQLYMMKGGAKHRILGRVWVTLMAVAALSSFFFTPNFKWFFGYSPIHLLSIYTLIMLFFAIYFIKKDNIRAHKITMICIYWLGLVLTGLFTLIPPRIMGLIFFG